MKKIVQLVLLITIASATQSYCWQWSDFVPTRLSTWYSNWKIEQQERLQVETDFKQLQKKVLQQWKWSSLEKFFQNAPATLETQRRRNVYEKHQRTLPPSKIYKFFYAKQQMKKE